MSRRRFVGSALAGVAAAVALPRTGQATEYGSAREVLSAIDALEEDVDRRLTAIARGLPAAGDFARSVLVSHNEHRAQRASLRARLGLPAPPAASSAQERPDRGLGTLRTAQEALVHAHAEGLPALHDRAAVALLARHMVVEARHLTVIDLWIELEEQRG